jgi:hypothetical protein
MIASGPVDGFHFGDTRTDLPYDRADLVDHLGFRGVRSEDRVDAAGGLVGAVPVGQHASAEHQADAEFVAAVRRSTAPPHTGRTADYRPLARAVHPMSGAHPSADAPVPMSLPCGTFHPTASRVLLPRVGETTLEPK